MLALIMSAATLNFNKIKFYTVPANIYFFSRRRTLNTSFMLIFFPRNFSISANFLESRMGKVGIPVGHSRQPAESGCTAASTLPKFTWSS